MANRDAAAVAQLAIRLGLVTDAQIQDCRDEVGELHGAPPESLFLALERKGFLTPWMSQKLLKGESEGYFLGGYRLLYKVASGSFGRVYRAEDPGTGRIVAIKVLRRRWSEGTEAPRNIELFEREGKVGLSLRHPNIVEILAVSRDVASKQYYIVMEFVEGGNLRDFLAIRKKIEPAEALRLLEDATAGLVYAYARGVTHRDMKLTNVLISSQGTAKLVDFGLAGVYSALGQKEDGKIERTVDYAGLEKATGVAQGDVRSDIYFLGCVLYEMLSGRSPLVKSKLARDRMDKNRFLNVQPMSRAEVNASASVFRLVETMMSLDPRLRYQTPSQLLDAIREARRELEGPDSGDGAKTDNIGSAAKMPRSVFIIEKKERLQDAMRDRFKELGYRVLLSVDPTRAVLRFKQQPFDALVVDIGSAGDAGLAAFEAILKEADRQKTRCAAIVLLSDEQVNWAERIPHRDNVAVFILPISLKKLHTKLEELVPLG